MEVYEPAGGAGHFPGHLLGASGPEAKPEVTGVGLGLSCSRLHAGPASVTSTPGFSKMHHFICHGQRSFLAEIDIKEF